MLRQFQTSYLASSDLYYELFHFSIKLVMSVACIWSWCPVFCFFSCVPTQFVLIDLSITLQMSTRLQLIQETQSASPVHRLQPISELACIPRPHDGALSESSAGPTRACQPAQCRFYSLFKNSAFLKQNSLKGFKKKS